MFFKTWHKKQVLFILNAFSSLVNVVYEERVGGGKLVFLLGPRAWSQEVWALFLAPLLPSCGTWVKLLEVSCSSL